ncbi:hypothetical protein AZI86_15915 [Bdellovibrio bacteriovorus]|uniref:Peptidase M28 domain-containing protein n=1 Tax=Bdellovibrio bacteriovorus TaxID=959 RepID=A0A150WHW8_BDEBC|nr:M28 family peptidase [Bdellovibrio bacteriovorus]KYG63188.1 hypothetical protein AZI86_15915 [Bdellovibrio bacteriovorus]
MKIRKYFILKLIAALFLFWVALFIFLRNPVPEGEALQRPITVNIENLKQDTYFLAGIKPSRSSVHPASVLEAEKYVMNRLKEIGYEWTLQEVKGEQGQVFHNIIFRYGASDSKDVVVIGAHLDSCDVDNPGADDNASGVAGLLELARFFKEQKPEVKTPIEFVVWALEEPPYFETEMMGSAVHANNLRDKGYNVKYAISLEMIGYFSNDSFSQEFPVRLLYLFYPNKGNFIGVIASPAERALVRDMKKAMNANSDLEAYSLNAPAVVPGVDFSDHRNYWKHGWPAVMVTDTSFYRNHAYHTPEDTPERLDYVKMGEVVKGVYAALLSLQ